MKNKKKCLCGGFTLVESVVAIFILSVGIFAILTMFVLGVKIINSSKTQAVGIQLAQEKMEEIISLSYDAISVGSIIESQLPAPFNLYTRETRTTYIDPSLNLQEISFDKGAKKVEVTVSGRSLLLNSEVISLKTIISRK